jgi:hypothetical protein
VSGTPNAAPHAVEALPLALDARPPTPNVEGATHARLRDAATAWSLTVNASCDTVDG